jgi:hypothetical protein
VFRADAGFTRTKEFRTVFAGPGAIRFAYRELPSEFNPEEFNQLVVGDAGTYSYSFHAAAPERGGSLEMAVAGMTGISGGLVIDILPLLQTGLSVPSALDMEDARVIGAEDVDGTPCDIIEAVSRPAAPEHVRVWIAQSDSLIRRLSEDDVVPAEELRKMGSSDDPHSTFTTVTFHPKCNEPVAPESLRATDGSL